MTQRWKPGARSKEPVWGSVSVACCHTASRVTARVSVACADKIVVNQGAYADALVRDRVILIHGDYAGGISSTKRGSLVLTDTEKGLVFESSVPDSQMGRDLIAQVEGIDVIARPIVDQDASTFTETNGVATYSAEWRCERLR